MVDNIGLQSVLCYAIEFKRFDNRGLSPPHIASARHPPLFSRLHPRTAPPLNRPPCSPRRAPPSPFQQPPSSPFTSACMPACQAAPESNRRIISPASPAPAPQRPQPLFLCAQTARLTHAAPAASPFSKNSPQKTSSSAPLLRKHQSSFRLHPPLHASHPFIARPPSPLPGTSPPSRARSIACFTWKHPARAAQRLLYATRCQRLRSRRLQPVQPPHAPKYPVGRSSSPFSSNVCPPYAGGIFPPFSPVPPPTPVHIPPASTPCPSSPGRLPRPCKSCTPQLCTCHVPPWAVPRAAHTPRWWHDRGSTAQALLPAPSPAPRGGCAPAVRTCMVHHNAHAPPPPHR